MRTLLIIGIIIAVAGVVYLIVYSKKKETTTPGKQTLPNVPPAVISTTVPNKR